jgi:hypothetical protein
MNDIKNNSIKELVLWLLIPYLVLCALHIILGFPMKVPIIWPDEYTYLFMAKYIGGSELLQHVPKSEVTGSFGYSMLISPFFRIFSDPTEIYRAIIAFNGVIASTLYIALFLFMTRIVGASYKQSAVISFIISLYPAYLLQSNYAYTDTLTPAYYIFCIVAFHNLFKNKTFTSALIFAFATGFLNWVHIRMLPFTLVSIVVLSFLVLKKKMNPLHGGISIIIMIVFVMLSAIIGDHLNLALTGKLDTNDRILTSLISIAEIVLIFTIIITSVYFILKRNILLFLYSMLGLLTGLMVSGEYLTILFIPIALIILLVLRIFKLIKTKQIFIASILLFGIFLLTYFVLPDIGYFTTVLYRIRVWFTNLSGVLYYALFGSFIFTLIGTISIVRELHLITWVDRTPVNVDEITDFSAIEKSGYEFGRLINNPEGASLLFMLLTALGMVIITVFPSELSAQHYRADHLFYGRYIEVVMAGFLAFGLFRLVKAEAKEYIITLSAAYLSFVILTFFMIFQYGNQITSELAFQSVLSFFPLRAILGNINIVIFSFTAIIISNIVAFGIRFKVRFGTLILGLAYLVFSLFTYYYVNYYYQIDKQERNKILRYLHNEFPDIKQVNYDLSIYTEKSQNGLNDIWLLPNIKFNFFMPIRNAKLNNLTIASSNYGISISPDALLFGIEHDGNDHLWIEPGELQDRVKDKIPSYYNIPLNKEYISGVYRSGFYKDSWINGKVEIKTPLVYADSIFKIEFIVGSSDPKPHNLIVWLDGDEVFNQDINQGVWKYNLNLSSKKKLNDIKLKFFSDLTRDFKDQSRLNGISLLSFKLLSQKDFYKDVIYPIRNDLKSTIIIEPRRNYNLSDLKLSSSDSVEIPMTIRNYGSDIIDFDKGDFYLNYKWDDFIFKREKDSGKLGYKLNGILKPGEMREIFIMLKTPAEPAKFFLNFVVTNHDGSVAPFYEYNSRHLLMDFRVNYQ